MHPMVWHVRATPKSMRPCGSEEWRSRWCSIQSASEHTASLNVTLAAASDEAGTWNAGDALLSFCQQQPFSEYVYVGPNGAMANWLGEKTLKRAPKVEFYLLIWHATPPSLSCLPALRASSPRSFSARSSLSPPSMLLSPTR